MLAGRRDVEFISQFSSNIANYSDDGETFHGAYGWRWRHHFAKDQLAECVNMLKANPLDRRAVMAMYDPTTDLNRDTKDVPCNTQIMWRMVSGKLHMTTTNRSNDLVWGLCGANFVHMTVLQEWAAAAIGVPIGYWHHFTNNLHVYPQHYSLMHANHHLLHWREYPDQARLVKDPWLFRVECKELCDGKIDYFKEPFFDGTVAPMVQAWHEYKGGNWREAMRLACCIDSDDWRIATTEWYERRKK